MGNQTVTEPLTTAMDLELLGLPMHLAGACKMEVVAMNATVFYIRLENLADSDFDTYYNYYENHANDSNIDIPVEDENNVVIPNFLDVNGLLALMIKKHLKGLVGVTMQIQETSLTGGELYTDMVQTKTKW